MNFYSDTPFQITWNLVDATGAPVTNVAMVATLYSHRSMLDPDLVPGSPVSGLTNVAMVQTTSAGVYQANVSAISSLYMPTGGDYILVIDGTLLGQPFYHKEEPSNVQVGN